MVQVVVLLLFASHVLSHHVLFGACAALCTLALLVHHKTMRLMHEVGERRVAVVRR